jgi:hypothetical protein
VLDRSDDDPPLDGANDCSFDDLDDERLLVFLLVKSTIKKERSRIRCYS